MLQSSVSKRLVLSRFFLNLAADHAHAHREVSAFAAANLLQDAVEMFLLAAAEQTNAKIDRKTEFIQYIDKIDEKISPRSLPFRARLIQLNKLRVSSKHDGIKPDYGELDALAVVAREFLREATLLVFGFEFSSISFLSQLEDGEARSHLSAAEEAFTDELFEVSLIECRKALYLTFLKEYDARMFLEGEPKGLFLLGNSVPFFARSKDYLVNNIRDPFDLIIIDHSKLDSDLLKDKIDPVDFWNVWRLTPEVYQRSDGTWLVKRELQKLEGESLAQNAAYACETTINLLLRHQEARRSARWTRSSTIFVVTVLRENVPVYAKADRSSAIVRTVPVGLESIQVTAYVPGLKSDDGGFWEVSHYETGLFMNGYIHEDDVDDERNEMS